MPPLTTSHILERGWPGRLVVTSGATSSKGLVDIANRSCDQRDEPVSLVVRPDQARDASAQCGKGVEIVQLVNDDCWMRDMGPLFLINGSGDLAGVDLNFNGWGNKQVHVNDALIAQEVLERLGIPRFVAPFVSEGGALEVDGNGTVMATESRSSIAIATSPRPKPN